MGISATASTLRGRARDFTGRARANGEHALFTRYVLVSGVFGLPASIIQLRLMLIAYHALIGDHNFWTLNAMWIANFELGLVRNFLLHCAVTWRTEPTLRRLGHMHVAAIGAFVIDIIAFNATLWLTGVIIIAQFVGASSGFGCNFLYNRLRTFGAPRTSTQEDALTEGGIA
jgi:putative flippase GtrA